MSTKRPQMVTQKSDRGMMFQCSGPSRAPRLPRGFIWGSKYVFFGTLRSVFSIFSRCLHTEFMSSSDSKQWLLSVLLCLTSSSSSFDFLDISGQARWTTACSFGVVELATFISRSELLVGVADELLCE